MALRRVLVANRGEIGVRIARACRALAIESVAAYSDADRHGPHVAAADAAVRLGPAPAAASYLSVPAVVAAARASGCDAVHPGYGFLSEQPELAEACEEAGLRFVGPPPTALRRLGDKIAARELAAAAGLPTVPGGRSPGDVPLPMLVKAAAGGGGRGLRVVRRRHELDEAVASAAREAEAAFGDPTLLFERYVEGARHVEVQVLADGQGRTAHLGLRDCSLQRRHQKVIEEAPAPGVDEAEAARLGSAACRLVAEAGYSGAGTVELLRTAEGEVFFLEVNARIQVEHPVTELVTGEDLVAWQLRVAGGERLPEEGLRWLPDGHAFEARLVAEDVDRGFLPAAGPLLRLDLPSGEGVRVDAGYAPGDEVTTFYDALIAKICVHGGTRADALARLRAALDRVVVVGVATNLPLLRAMAADRDVAAGHLDTTLLERSWRPAPAEGVPRSALEAAAAFAAREPSTDPLRGRFRVGLGRSPLPPAARAPDGTVHVLLDGRDHAVRPPAAPDAAALARAGGVATGAGAVEAPLPGRVVTVRVTAGDAVASGDVLLTLEAMKMEHPVNAPYDGVVTSVACDEGDLVAGGALLIEIEAR